MADRIRWSNYIKRDDAISACIRTREEVTRYLSEEGSVYHTENAENIGNLLKKFETHIYAVSAADVVEVIRCIDCAKCEEKDMFGLARILECKRTDRATKPDGFCAWAERRKSDG